MVNIPSNASENDGTLQGTVTITSAMGNDLLVNLSSSDTSEAKVPDSVTITKGQTTGTFDITIVDDQIVDGTQTVTITASAGGWNSGDDKIDILDDDCPECYGVNLEVKNITFNAGTTCECKGEESLTIGPNVNIKKGAKVVFKSPKINVTSGVHAEEGSTVEMKQK